MNGRGERRQYSNSECDVGKSGSVHYKQQAKCAAFFSFFFFFFPQLWFCLHVPCWCSLCAHASDLFGLPSQLPICALLGQQPGLFQAGPHIWKNRHKVINFPSLKLELCEFFSSSVTSPCSGKSKQVIAAASPALCKGLGCVSWHPVCPSWKRPWLS